MINSMKDYLTFFPALIFPDSLAAAGPLLSTPITSNSLCVAAASAAPNSAEVRRAVPSNSLSSVAVGSPANSSRSSCSSVSSLWSSPPPSSSTASLRRLRVARVSRRLRGALLAFASLAARIPAGALFLFGMRLLQTFQHIVVFSFLIF